MRRRNALIVVFLQILLLALTQTATSQSQETNVNYVGGYCFGDETINSNSTYHSNILTLLTNLNSFSSVNQFFSNSSGLGSDRVNGFYLCRPDLPLSTCKACINTSIKKFNQFCLDEMQGILWYEECMIQYTNNSVSPTNGNGQYPWDYYYSSSFNVSEPEIFPKLMTNTMQNLISEAISPDNPQPFFAFGKANYTEFEEFNGLVFCRPDITAKNCESCLRTALDRIPGCCGNIRSWTMVLQPYCQLRYDTAPFIFSPNSPS